MTLFFLVFALAVTQAVRWGDRQFRQENIEYDAEYFTGSPTDMVVPVAVKAALDQPYTYLDRGKQAFAFVSADGRYVLKFFDRSRLRQWSDHAAAVQRMHQVVHGYTVAAQYDRDHVGLLYVHMMPTQSLLPTVDLTDRFGFSHKIDLNAVPFVLQDKAVPTRVYIARLLDAGKNVEADRAFEAIYAMYTDEHSRGVYDGDHNVMVNTGFVGDTPIRIDAGRLTINKGVQRPVRSRQEIDKLKEERITPWLQKH